MQLTTRNTLWVAPFSKNRKHSHSVFDLPPLKNITFSFLTVDYERSTFRVSQAKWTPNASQNITNILSPADSTPTVSPSKPDSSHKLSTGATVGIIVAAICLCLLLIGVSVGWFLWRRKKRRDAKLDSQNSTDEKAEFPDTSQKRPTELDGDAKEKQGMEMEGSPGPKSDRAEAPGTPGGVEMEGSRGGAEMEGSGVAEMDGRGPGEVFELPAGDFLAPVTEIDRRGRRSPASSRSLTSPLSIESDSQIGNLRDRERRRERDRRRERGRAEEQSRRWSWRRTQAEEESI